MYLCIYVRINSLTYQLLVHIDDLCFNYVLYILYALYALYVYTVCMYVCMCRHTGDQSAHVVRQEVDRGGPPLLQPLSTAVRVCRHVHYMQGIAYMYVCMFYTYNTSSLCTVYTL